MPSPTVDSSTAPARSASTGQASAPASASAPTGLALRAAESPSARSTPPLTLPALIEREQRRRSRRRWWWIGIGLAVPLIVVGVWLATRARPIAQAARFRTLPVTHGEVVREVRATGHVEAVSTVSVGAEISGRIAEVLVDFNVRVKAGQVLARFDRAALEAQRAQSLASLAATRAQVAQARFDLAQARRVRARADALFAQHALAAAEHDAAVTSASLSEARLHAAEAQQAAQEAASSIAATNLDHSLVRSPIDGVIITRNVDPGQTVASALATPVLFTVAADLSRMRVVAAVDEADIAQVADGQRARFTVTAWPDRTFEGRVTEVRNSPVIVQDVVTYGSVVQVDNSDLALRPGMTASVRIVTASVANVDRVPNAALHFTPPDTERDASVPSVYVLDPAGPRRVSVMIGISDGELTGIAAGVLSVGTPVLVELTTEGKKLNALQHPM